MAASPHPNPLVRKVWVVLGFGSLVLAVIGAILPIMPTTCFVILAAACFARGSTRFHGWIRNNRLFGPMVRDWEQHRSMPLRAKLVAVPGLVISLGTSIYLFIENPWVQGGVALVGASIVALILRIPTSRPKVAVA
jgi:uncharacterized membrane protein YbaN (DUF454 family)